MSARSNVNHESLNEKDKLRKQRESSRISAEKERWANDFLFGETANLTARYFGILEEALND